MTTNGTALLNPARDVAREVLYRYLAAALTEPRRGGSDLVQHPENQRLVAAALEFLREDSAGLLLTLGFGELPAEDLNPQALLGELPTRSAALQRSYEAAFGLVSTRECPLYETEYHPNADPFFRAQQMADVTGFYRAFGLQPGRTHPDRPDHLALELEFMAFLLMKKRAAGELASLQEREEQRATCSAAEKSFFHDHLAWWVPSFAAGLRHRSGAGFYAEVARQLAAWFPLERYLLDVEPPSAPVKPRGESSTQDEDSSCAGCALASV